MEKINEAWKNASEEMYKAEQPKGSADAGADTGAKQEQAQGNAGKADDTVEDVDFEEVK